MNFSFLSYILHAHYMTFSWFWIRIPIWESSASSSNTAQWCYWAVHGLQCIDVMQLWAEDWQNWEMYVVTHTTLIKYFQEEMTMFDNNASVLNLLYVMKAEFITMLIIRSLFGIWHCVVCMEGTSVSNEHAASYFRVKAGRSSFLWKPQYVMHNPEGFHIKV